MRKELLILGVLLTSMVASAQEQKVTLSGSIQSDMMIALQQDASIGTSAYDNEYFLTNTYANLNLQSRWVDAGARFELTQWPMPGFKDDHNDFKGWGFPNLWVKGKLGKADITLGSFYEQFGSGFILRSYEERSLGIDNSLLGAHIATTPVKGVTLKVLSGRQRNYWELNKSLVSGADMEIGLENYCPRMVENGTVLAIGGSWVNKYEENDDIIMADPTHRLNLPEFTNAFDARLRYQQKGYALLAEYAWKSQDPNSLNNYIYLNGHAELLSMTYSGHGISLLAQAKRSENMGFRSQRMEHPSSKASYINHLPAFTLDQTYALPALYPYATQMEGEWAYQASAAYKFKGRYAPKFKLNFSRVNGLSKARRNVTDASVVGTDGYQSAFWRNGDKYYQDLDLMYEHKLNKAFEHHFMYMYQNYNKEIIQSENEGGMINSHIFVYEPKWKINKKMTLRGELQYLYTAHESGDWGFLLAELSLAPYLMFTVSDQIGRCEPSSGEYGDVKHYYNFGVTGNIKSHRIQLSYGRTRSGYNCNGGMCRYIPASKGVRLSYNYNF